VSAWTKGFGKQKRCRRQLHHSLKIGQLVSHGGLKGRIRGYSPDRVLASQPQLKDAGEWYFVEIYASDRKPNSHFGTYWKVHRAYLEVR
jgi:hypothetical protein